MSDEMNSSKPVEQMIEQNAVPIPERPKRESYPAHGSGFIVFYPVSETDKYIGHLEAELAVEREKVQRLEAALRAIVVHISLMSPLYEMAREALNLPKENL